MKSVLYYFTGTGNTLAVAKRLKAGLGDCELVSIPQVMAGGSEALPGSAAPVVGIISPIYMYNMPHMVSRFLATVRQPEYLFMVYTGGGELGSGLRKTKNQIRKHGLQLSALFNVPMPSNYTPYGYPTEEEQAERFNAADQKISRIVETVAQRASFFDGNNTSFLRSHVHPGILYQMGYRFISKMDGGFSVDDRCTGCGLCERVCPAGNISMVDGRPVWNHACEQCYGCLQWCPVSAIEYGKGTRGVQRYHHPEVHPREIQASGPFGARPET